jgi:MoxR-like ATPase
VLDHPSRDEERAIVDRYAANDPVFVAAVATVEDVRRWQSEARALFLDERIRDYLIDIVRASRVTVGVVHGASPRAALALAALARARAYLEGRAFVTPDDVRSLAPAVLRHRLSFDYRLAASDGDPVAVVREIVARVPAP